MGRRFVVKYLVKGVYPDGKRKFRWEFSNKQRAKEQQKACLELGFLRASVKKIKVSKKQNG